MFRAARMLGVFAGVAAAVVLPSAQSKRVAGEWSSYGGTNWSQKYSSLDQITRSNFSQLRVAWTWRSPDHDLLQTLPRYPEMPLHANRLKGTPEGLARWPTVAPLDGTPLPYVPNGKIGKPSLHPANPPAPAGPQGLPLVKPPYSRMTAYDLNKGDIAWQVPTGPGQDRIRRHPALAGVDLPPLGGQGSPGGPLVTKMLLIYGLVPTVGGAETGSKLVAYDKATGATLAEVALPASPLGTPMTYLAGGKQYVALTLQGGQMIALTLP